MCLLQEQCFNGLNNAAWIIPLHEMTAFFQIGRGVIVRKM